MHITRGVRKWILLYHTRAIRQVTFETVCVILIANVYINNSVGFLANDDESYASALHTIFTMSDLQLRNIQINARQLAMEKFSENVFKESMLDVLESILSESRDF